MPPAPPTPPSVLLLAVDSVVAAETGTCGRSLGVGIAVAARARPPLVVSVAALDDDGGGESDGAGGIVSAAASKSYDTLTTRPEGEVGVASAPADEVSEEDDDDGGGDDEVAKVGVDCVRSSRGERGGDRDGGDRAAILHNEFVCRFGSQIQLSK